MTENEIPENETETPENAAEELRQETAAEALELEEHDRFAELEADFDKMRQDLLYARAETENVRRRHERELAEAHAYAATKFARDMLSVADNLARGLAAIPDDLKSDDKLKGVIAGIEATGREIDTVFERHGISRIDTIGEPLDPNRHQAMVEIPDDSAEPGTIVQEMQSGYMIKDRLLRPALVGVAKKP
ncbi:MAG: nucleotide exchange factor GrpE [Sphingomonadales bacterium]|nr:nucleotide exchange factor GrpE [Sphingomonadales bacterium]